MSISRVEMEVPDAVRVEVSDEALIVDLSDARTISARTMWDACWSRAFFSPRITCVRSAPA